MEVGLDVEVAEAVVAGDFSKKTDVVQHVNVSIYAVFDYLFIDFFRYFFQYIFPSNYQFCL